MYSNWDLLMDEGTALSRRLELMIQYGDNVLLIGTSDGQWVCQWKRGWSQHSGTGCLPDLAALSACQDAKRVDALRSPVVE